MPSKKRSNTSRSKEPPKTRFFIDRNLGAFCLAEQLRAAGFDVRVHDDFYHQKERDPWIFYECGKQGYIVVTSDTEFVKSFPHMAAIALAHTTVLAFSNNNYKSEVRGNAFLKALPRITGELSKHKKRRKNRYFIAVVGMHGSLTIKADAPLPHRKTCATMDWESYERVCAAEGVLLLTPKH